MPDVLNSSTVDQYGNLQPNIHGGQIPLSPDQFYLSSSSNTNHTNLTQSLPQKAVDKLAELKKGMFPLNPNIQTLDQLNNDPRLENKFIPLSEHLSGQVNQQSNQFLGNQPSQDISPFAYNQNNIPNGGQLQPVHSNLTAQSTESQNFSTLDFQSEPYSIDNQSVMSTSPFAHGQELLLPLPQGLGNLMTGQTVSTGNINTKFSPDTFAQPELRTTQALQSIENTIPPINPQLNTTEITSQPRVVKLQNSTPSQPKPEEIPKIESSEKKVFKILNNPAFSGRLKLSQDDLNKLRIESKKRRG